MHSEMGHEGTVMVPLRVDPRPVSSPPPPPPAPPPHLPRRRFSSPSSSFSGRKGAMTVTVTVTASIHLNCRPENQSMHPIRRPTSLLVYLVLPLPLPLPLSRPLFLSLSLSLFLSPLLLLLVAGSTVGPSLAASHSMHPVCPASPALPASCQRPPSPNDRPRLLSAWSGSK